MADEPDIAKVLPEMMRDIIRRSRDELLALSQEEMAARWWFEYDPKLSAEWNLYQFSKTLNLYSRSCRDWEEHYNGSMCVVERVRDTYLMPRISEFLKALLAQSPPHREARERE